MNIQMVNTNGRIVPLLFRRFPSHISVFFSFLISFLISRLYNAQNIDEMRKAFSWLKKVTEEWIQLLVVKNHEIFQAVTSFGSLRNHLQNSTRKNFVPCCSMIVITLLQLHLIILILLWLFVYFVQLSFSFGNNTANLHGGVEVDNSNSTSKEKKIVTIHVLLERRNQWAN